MPTPTQQQAMIEEAVRTFIDGFLNNSSFSRSWNAFLTQSPEFAAAIYEVVTGAEYTGGDVTAKQGTITAVGPTAVDAVNGFPAHGNFNIALWDINPTAPWKGTVRVERSFDGGAVWVPVLDVSTHYFRLFGTFSIRMFEPEANVLYRLYCEEVHGPNDPANDGANYRFSQ